MRTGLPWSGVLVAVVVVGAAVPAPLAAAPPSTTVEDPDRTVARRYFERGAADYERGDYQAALHAFAIALELSPSPALHYNIARCADRLGEWARAADEYERYLPSAPEPERVGLVERIRTLRARQQTTTPTPTTTPPLPLPKPTPIPPPVVRAPATVPAAAERARAAAPTRTPDSLGRAAIAVGAVALAGAAVGAGLYGSARVDFNGLERTCQLRQCAPPDWASVDQRAAAAYAAWAVAAAAAATDVALWIARAQRRRRERLVIAPAPAGLVVGGQF
jgi:tetratricopeptide (TPR) repeat protein